MARERDRRFVIWPEYFDASLTKADGRRTPRDLSFKNPRVDQVALAAKSLEMNPVVQTEAAFPARWHQKGGKIIIERVYPPKSRSIRLIAKKMQRMYPDLVAPPPPEKKAPVKQPSVQQSRHSKGQKNPLGHGGHSSKQKKHGQGAPVQVHPRDQARKTESHAKTASRGKSEAPAATVTTSPTPTSQPQQVKTPVASSPAPSTTDGKPTAIPKKKIVKKIIKKVKVPSTGSGPSGSDNQ